MFFLFFSLWFFLSFCFHLSFSIINSTTLPLNLLFPFFFFFFYFFCSFLFHQPDSSIRCFFHSSIYSNQLIRPRPPENSHSSKNLAGIPIGEDDKKEKSMAQTASFSSGNHKTSSNLERFLQCVTPCVPWRTLPRVIFFFLQFIFFYFIVSLFFILHYNSYIFPQFPP